jgi:methionyl-tRNA formyltransferase
MHLKVDDIERVVLLGGGHLLLALARWCQSEGAPISVVTAPRHAAEIIEYGNSLDEILSSENIPLFVADDIASKEVSEFLGDLSKAFCLSLGAAWIFNDEVINSQFYGRLFNLHGTRLPQNRGGGGSSWQIMMGNRFGFCQLHLVDGGVDTGSIVKTEEFLYPPSCRIPKEYDDVHFKRNFNFVTDFIEQLRQGGVDIETIRQTEYFSSYFPRLNTNDHGWINWTDGVMELERFICAFDDPYEGAKCFWDDQVVYVKKVCVDFSDQSFHSYQSGIVYRNNGKWLCVCAVGGSLIIEEVLDSDGKNLIQKIKVGDRLITKTETLNERLGRVVYTPVGKKTKK